MAKYKAYPEYKDSGVEWIDSIPSHWYVKPTFALCEATAKKNIDGAESNVLSLSYGNIIPRDVETNFGLLPESFNTYQIIDYGDVILRLTDLQNDKNSLRVGLAKQNGIITSAYLKLKAKIDMNSTFLYRLLHSYDTTKVFYGMGGGLRQSMKFEDFRRLPLLLPPIAEQLNISAFLDHETAKIDNLIEKQKQLIELLKEKRQAVISHTVTKGLNPDVAMKDSGVEWLGEVPEHWDVSQIKYLSSFVGTGGTPKNPESFTDIDGINWFSPGDFNGSLVLQDAKKKISKSSVHNGDSKIYPENSIVVIGIGATLGKVALAASLFSCNQQINIIVPNEKIEPNYLAHSLSNQMEQMKQSSNASTIGIMNQEKTKQIWIALPKIDEQLEIIEFLLKKTTEFDLLLNWSDKQIQLLQERRTALISAAVTGKIDVRDWVAPDTSDIEASEEATA
ncbi:restriction endonuclease subunit S [Buttiauxella sp.]|uniref:restriction endonuclease subunit S n=1 Tax=Buttiauxella sp. TaxID=1972222 RepID=UPI003C761054